MKARVTSFIVVLLFTTGSMHAQSIWDAEHLKTVKQSIQEQPYSDIFQELKVKADKLLNAVPYSVMDKEKTPASGDKHDYMSQARYYWPDPTKPDGLPYISRDGESNPELNKLDRNRLGSTASRITTLSLAWYFSNDERYAQKATELIRVWFFNKDTRMNPNLEYAQMIPGRHNNKGRSFGVIDTYSFIEMLDAVQLLEQSQAFTSNDSKQLKAWFGELLNWILTSEQGKEEHNAKNNHSIAYDAQVIAFAMYAGDQATAERFVKEFPEKRVYKQVEPDGKQPQELRRTLAFGYSEYNLQHMLDIFVMGKKMGLSLDNSTSSDGRNFYKAADFLAAYLGKDVSAWPYQQISDWNMKQQELCKDLYRIYLMNPARTDYLSLYKTNNKIDIKSEFILLYVRPEDISNK